MLCVVVVLGGSCRLLSTKLSWNPRWPILKNESPRVKIEELSFCAPLLILNLEGSLWARPNAKPSPYHEKRGGRLPFSFFTAHRFPTGLPDLLWNWGAVGLLLLLAARKGVACPGSGKYRGMGSGYIICSCVCACACIANCVLNSSSN